MQKTRKCVTVLAQFAEAAVILALNLAVFDSKFNVQQKLLRLNFDHIQ